MVQLKNKLPCILAAITLVLTAAEAASASVRGVAPEKYELYKASSDGTWTCLDGSKIISHSAINDDYCDCVDGSDEPGTSACPNGLFYCANVGHIPSTIKSYAVNDGVCDEACCDGSDENGGLITCPDRCKAVGEAYRRDQSSLQQSTLAGLAAKEKLIEEAENQVTLWEEQQIKLEDEIILKKSNVLRLQRELKALEAARTTKKKTKCQSNVLEIDTLKHDITILLKELESLKSILGDMKRDHNHNFHDMAVKSAITGYDDFMNRYEGIKESINDDVANINVQEPEEQEEEEEEEPTIEEETIDSKEEGKHSFAMTIVEKLESILPDVLKKSLLDKLVPIVKNDNKKAIPHSGISNEADVENARKLYEAADSEVDQLTAELQKIKDDLAIDYGTQREWLKLKDVCVEKDEGEYTYSLCFLGDAYQKSNKDSTRTFLGKFSNFDDGNYKTHAHSQGTRCWNGPERSVKATIECGVNNEIIEVSEPEKCEYHFRMLSPAVCQRIQESTEKTTNNKPIHEEL